MAVVIKQGIWDNATYPWTDQASAGFMGSIVAEIDAWITAISSNASIVANGQLPVKVREPSDSTNSGTRNGFGYEFPDTTIGLNADGPTYPTLLIHGTETSLTTEVGDEFEDDTQNDGFGDLGLTPGHYSLTSVPGTSGTNREAIVAYDTTDEQEFIAVGFKLGTTNTRSGGFAVFKDTDGHWCFVVRDIGFSYDTHQGYWTGQNGPYDIDPEPIEYSSIYAPFVLKTTDYYGSQSRAGFDSIIQQYWYPANPALYSGRGASDDFGNFSRINSDTEAIVSLGYNTAAVRVTI